MHLNEQVIGVRYFHLLIIILGVGIMSCHNQNSNPFFNTWNTSFEVPPFDQIETSHYMPALLAGIEKEQAEIDGIVANTSAPTFANTIEAYEASGRFLERVELVMENLSGTDATDELDQVESKYNQLKSKHRDDIILNENLFSRIKQVYNSADRNKLTTEQNTLLDKIYQDFVRNGANLSQKDKDNLRQINQELSLAMLEFGQACRRETNTWKMILNDETELAGLPERVKTAAAELAKQNDLNGKWVFTLDKPSLLPFLQYSKHRDLRKKMFDGYINRGNNNDEFDNKERLVTIVNLRIERARLLGYNSHAEYALERSMAKTIDSVDVFLKQLWEPAMKRARTEADDLQAQIDREGDGINLQPWDWWYYAEKLRQEKYDLDENQIRPYFPIEKVINGAYMVANHLYGITVTERHDLPVYHPDVQAWEVKEADGKHIGIFFTDYHPRKGKQVGAWSSSFRPQSNREGNWITPVVVNVCNFSPPTGEKPALLSFEEVETLFHEFGHALHSLLRTRTYTDQLMPRDFVELPSQILENWAAEPEVLKMYAHHYQTGEPIPDELIEKLQKAALFNQGFISTEYLAASILDMDWHTLTADTAVDPIEYEKAVFERIGLLPEIVTRYHSTYFNHAFSWSYSAGYYSYIWAAVLDSDAFQAFKDSGDLFDQELAAKFRKYVLGLSGTEDAMEIYRQFRGQDPSIEPLLVKRGLN